MGWQPVGPGSGRTGAESGVAATPGMLAEALEKVFFIVFSGLEMVGVRGFEPPAPASRRRCSTKLSYTPTNLIPMRAL